MQRLVIFANGPIADLQDEARRYLHPNDRLIAADGGLRYVLALGLRPERLIVDGDSLPPGADLQGIPWLRYPPEKDETDLELALQWAAAQPERLILVLGALGGRPDHELANLLLLALPVLQGKRVWLLGGAWGVTLIRGGERLTVHAAPGTMLSLIPLGGPAEGITTAGLKYPLRDEPLQFGPARGVSNVILQPQAHVTLRKGTLWCFVAWKDAHPFLPEEVEDETFIPAD